MICFLQRACEYARVNFYRLYTPAHLSLSLSLCKNRAKPSVGRLKIRFISTFIKRKFIALCFYMFYLIMASKIPIFFKYKNSFAGKISLLYIFKHFPACSFTILFLISFLKWQTWFRTGGRPFPTDYALFIEPFRHPMAMTGFV